jgi:phytol kinase
MAIIDFAIELTDVIVFFIAVFYAGFILIVGDLGRRKFNLGSDFTRKIVHLFAGFAIWTFPYYPNPWVATLVALTFVIMLGLTNTERFGRFFAAMARPDDLEHGSVRGPFWYAVSITVLTGLFTFTGNQESYLIAAAAIQIMMLGDGMSAPIGMRYGLEKCYTIFGSKRSVHGSLALFFFGFIGAMLAFWFFGIFNYGVLVSGSVILWQQMIILALSGSIAATMIELISPKGTDNITVPFLSCVVMLLIALGQGLIVLV